MHWTKDTAPWENGEPLVVLNDWISWDWSVVVSLAITLFAVGRLLINIPAGLLSFRYGRKPFLIAGTLTLVLSSVGAALSSSFECFLLWRFLQGMGSGIYMTITSAMVIAYAKPNERGAVMGFYQAGIFLRARIGPVVGGSLAKRFGLTAPFWA